VLGVWETKNPATAGLLFKSYPLGGGYINSPIFLVCLTSFPRILHCLTILSLLQLN